MKDICDTLILDNIVCELPCYEYTPGFKWYEIQISSLEENNLITPQFLLSSEANFIAASHTKYSDECLNHISIALCRQFKYILFESVSNTPTIQAVELIKSAGAVSIAACHINQRISGFEDILLQLRRMADIGANIVKVAYPAFSSAEIGYGLIAMEKSRTEIKVPVSITPMGTSWGRIAAALAGSFLVFAPLLAEPRRFSANDTVQLIKKMITMTEYKSCN
jgi:hypothetical protein